MELRGQADHCEAPGSGGSRLWSHLLECPWKTLKQKLDVDFRWYVLDLLNRILWLAMKRGF